MPNRTAYYRKVALQVGVPVQFLDDAVHEIEREVSAAPDVPWRQVARYTAIDQMRFWRKTVGSEHEPRVEMLSLGELLRPPQTDDEGLHDPLDEQDKRHATYEILALLPLRQHCVVQLRLEGWSLMDIAELLGISESRTARIEKQGVTRLRKALSF